MNSLKWWRVQRSDRWDEPQPLLAQRYPDSQAALGWQCPICGAVYAPSQPRCWQSHALQTTSTNSLAAPLVPDQETKDKTQQ
jgi:uncharacterized OB-fold protein